MTPSPLFKQPIPGSLQDLTTVKARESSMNFGEVLVQVFTFLVWSITYFIVGLLRVHDYGSTYYPQAWQYVLSLMCAYLVYKLIGRVLRLWLMLVVSAVKTTLFFICVFVVLYVYARGWNLVTQDLNILRAMVSSKGANGFQSGGGGWQKALFSNIFSRFQQGGAQPNGFAGSIFEDYGIEVDPSILESLNSNLNGKSAGETYEEVHGFVHDNMDHINNFLHNQGVDFNGVRDNIMNVLNNNY